MFQSSPAPEGECNLSGMSLKLIESKFQSSPAPEGECNPRGGACTADASQRFQSSPALRASATPR